jgi:hypothetical protein
LSWSGFHGKFYEKQNENYPRHNRSTSPVVVKSEISDNKVTANGEFPDIGILLNAATGAGILTLTCVLLLTPAFDRPLCRL